MNTNVFFTADHHWCHKNILRHRLQFQSIGAMTEVMVTRWNSAVKPGARVYHLGDVVLNCTSETAREILNRLNGQIYLIAGNHDKVARNRMVRDRFIWIKDYHRLKIGDQKICLFHYAQRTWDCMHYGSWQLHGHSHGSLPELPHRSFDVGVDCWDFTPVSYEQVAAKMATKTFVSVDHHRQ